ncbi:S1 family peptidase [Sinorhizobium meliloti]|uniref:S1 family peptidase n=1 Tax=Rhizobium meliloti TaxID=382 RepID=UPI000FD706B1|nr:serine protease [Sinorhizobium meliloti]RVL37966.1 serine protease [Sinorhizobium meliloti]
MRFKRTLAASAFLALTGAAVFAPDAAAYINRPHTPPAMTVAIERAAYRAPVTDAATVLIQRPNSKGTGFHIGGGRIITAAHVVDGAKTVSLKSIDGRISSATVVKVDTKTEIAILQTNMRLLPAEIDCGTVPVGTQISAIGNPLGQEFITAFGRIAGAPREMPHARSVYVTDMTTVMGQSGAPVFADGRVIGVVSAVMLAPFELVGNVAPDSGVYARSLVGFGYVVPSAEVCSVIGGEVA